jgi:hypothetical protein
MPKRDLIGHLVVAALTAALLAWMRKGFRDAPSVLVFFGLLGFLGSLAFSLALRPASQRWLDTYLGSSWRARLLRHLAAFLVVAAIFLWGGRAILDVGAGAWLLFLFICAVAPLAVCLLAPTGHLVWGFVVATAITASIWLENLQRPWSLQQDYMAVLPFYVFMWLLALGLALLVALPRHLYSRAPDGASSATPDPVAVHGDRTQKQPAP